MLFVEIFAVHCKDSYKKNKYILWAECKLFNIKQMVEIVNTVP